MTKDALVNKGQIIFMAVLLVVFMAGCNNKDKPKEAAAEKKISADTVCKSEIDTTNIKKTDAAKTPDSIKTQTPEKQAKVILVTTSEGCKCSLAKCGEGEKNLTTAISSLKGKLTLEKIDYSKEREKVNALSQEYKFYGLPTALFFDADGKFIKKIESTLDEQAIKETLTGLGVK